MSLVKCAADTDKKKDNYIDLEKSEKFNLLKLSTKHSNEILSTIIDKDFIFFSCFKEKSIEKDILAHMLIILGKACDSDSIKNLQVLIRNINYNHDNLLLHLQIYFVFLVSSELKQIYIDSLYFTLILMKKYHEIMPSSASEFLSILLPLFGSVCEKCLNVSDEKNEYDIIKKMYAEIIGYNEFFLRHHTFSDIKNRSQKEKLYLLDPPENFRSISALPTLVDIKSPNPFLRPNVVKGRYRDTEHYLDIQYRLLREDYVMPFRDGIAEYLNLKKNNESFRHCKNVKVYSNVQIKEVTTEWGDLLYTLKFTDKGFTEIQWKKNKRFLTGSLLCLSFNDFETIYFASVKHRDTDKLEQGLLIVKFEEITQEILNFSYSMNFVVLETSAYFESYYHNLQALLQLNSETLPFKRYIIDVEKNIFPPLYLDEFTEYDMSPLFIPIDQKDFKKVPKQAKHVKVLHTFSWPSAADINLNDSQHFALKAAVTKECAIIQGPPGTGKTYIGLRIVQLLLHNINSWFDSEKNALPILVVCFTNHALDQFLEGVLLFTKAIVRVGGRSSNENVLKYQLQNLKREYGIGMSTEMYEIKQETEEKMDKIKEKIKRKMKLIENYDKNILTKNFLKKYMTPNHFKTLQKGFKNEGIRQNDEFTLCDWLGINALTIKPDVLKRNKSENIETKNYSNNSKSEISVVYEDEDDVQNTENERNIDFPEYYENAAAERGWSQNDSEQNTTVNPILQKQQYIQNSLNNTEAMAEKVAKNVKHVWKLDISKRWKLYKYWLNKYIRDHHSDFIGLLEKLKTSIQKINEIKAEQNLDILKQSAVVGMTTNGAAKYRHLVRELNPAILIVEEAAEVLESHIVTSLAPNTQHLILIGDQQQLRPSTTMHLLSVKYNMNISLFERMVLNDVEYCKLSVQHRMRPEIASLIVPHIYTNLENHKTVTEFEDIRGVTKNVFFVSHNFYESLSNDSKTRSNKHEAQFIVELCRYLILQGYEPSQITVLTTYTGQLFVLKDLAYGIVKDVRFTVVDNFQGEENDIILISFVRSNEEGIIGFLRESNRVCVALSRAKKGLFCIGNFDLLAEKSVLWKNIRETLIQSQEIGPSLPLVCQNHPDTVTKVAVYEDFKKVPDGGCSRKCETRLMCGHACLLMCHPYSHEIVQCQKPCPKICERNHPCDKKCYEECYCSVEVDITLKKCGHTVKKYCGTPEDEVLCPCPCDKKCKNGHQCEKKCYEGCYCEVLISRELTRCGHTITEMCGKPENLIKCPLKCSKLLKCTHQCSNICGIPCNSKCVEPCLKYCMEGHKCQRKCYQTCEICQILIDRKCLVNHEYQIKCHRRLTNFCPILVEKTLKNCGHTVNIACGRRENTYKCVLECKKTLSCSHKCLNRCSEPCERNCHQPCIKTCAKGHKCSKLCNEACGSCETLVDRTLLKCSHTVKAPCGLLEENVICSSKCEKKLLCGHDCTNMCGKQCTIKCKHLVETKSLICGHPVKVECYIVNGCVDLNKRTYELSMNCSEPCHDVLPCGHKCTGTCGRCYQQRLHIPCNAPCEKFLVCGHKCLSKCFISCPPCKQPCENKCVHQICPKECHEPCRKCTKQCEWSCQHKKCTRPCHEICNRNPCDEPCLKLLLCSHPCMGFCGEPCPKLCRTCNNKPERESFFIYEDNARYVVLEDCGHVFEAEGLNQWMKFSQGENQKVRMKRCPQCKTIIRKNLRHNNSVKDSFLQIEKIKMMTRWNKQRNEEIQANLLSKSVSLTSSAFFEPNNNIIKSLYLSSIRNLKDLTNIENFISLATILSSLKIKVKNYDNGVNENVQPLIDYLKINSQWLVSSILKYFLIASEQQQIQLSYEIYRLKLMESLLHCATPQLMESYYDEFSVCLQCILNYKPFNDTVEKVFISNFNTLTSKLQKSCTAGLPGELPYLKAMNMSAGHWCLCLKKHVYCIIDYVGTNGRGCYECRKENNKHVARFNRSSDNSKIKIHLPSNNACASEFQRFQNEGKFQKSYPNVSNVFYESHHYAEGPRTLKLKNQAKTSKIWLHKRQNFQSTSSSLDVSVDPAHRDQTVSKKSTTKPKDSWGHKAFRKDSRTTTVQVDNQNKAAFVNWNMSNPSENTACFRGNVRKYSRS